MHFQEKTEERCFEMLILKETGKQANFKSNKYYFVLGKENKKVDRILEP